jgi:hypothetical protein
MKKLLFSIDYNKEVSDFSLPYDGSMLKECAKFTEGVRKILTAL